jgi:hypothetical protein
MKSLILATSLLAMTAGLAFGQSPTGYDKATEITVRAPIRIVLSAASPDGIVGVHLELKTPTGPVRVALGPALFIASNNYYFFADEQVYVVGAKAKSGEIWARTISKDDGKTFLTLRDEDGTPRWQQATEDDPDGCGVSHTPIR